MLFLLFQLDQDRYAIPVREIVEVLPLLHIKKILQAPPGVAGIFNYRGTPVPVIDVSEMATGKPVAARLSTRIILVNYDGEGGLKHVVGLLAERATQMIRRDPKEFFNPGVSVQAAPYLGPVTNDGQGLIQRIELVRLLSDAVRNLLFPQALERIQ
jgi:chemotaxis-related protein WspB